MGNGRVLPDQFASGNIDGLDFTSRLIQFVNEVILNGQGLPLWKLRSQNREKPTPQNFTEQWNALFCENKEVILYATIKGETREVKYSPSSLVKYIGTPRIGGYLGKFSDLRH